MAQCSTKSDPSGGRKWYARRLRAVASDVITRVPVPAAGRAASASGPPGSPADALFRPAGARQDGCRTVCGWL